MESIQINPEPQYWKTLSYKDQQEYAKLRKALSSPACKNRRNKSIATFAEIVDTIHNYVVQGDENDNKRALVCGITWIDDGVAINTHQLRLLISKCKSSINGSFQAMGYGTIPTASDSAGQLIQQFPFLKNNFPELRQWTVRKLITTSHSNLSLSEIVLKSSEEPKADQNTDITPPTSFEESVSLNSEGVTLSVNGFQEFEESKTSISFPPSPSSDKDINISNIDQLENHLLDEFPSNINDDPFSFMDHSPDSWGDDIALDDYSKIWN